MKILALNCGSSSLKYKLYEWDTKRSVAEGNVEKIPLGEHTHALEGVLKGMPKVYAIGHRVVHGGEKFTKSVLIDDNVLDTIGSLSVIAPLHNPPNLLGIMAAKALMPFTPQVAVFDTAFHQTMPEKAYHYAVPNEWYAKHGIRRYGFHGTSHLYVSKRAAVMLGKPAKDCNLITLHIGNGVSVTAIKNGVSVDTSMGFTPLEGAVMGTRCGDLDAAVPLYLQRKLSISTDRMSEILNKESGLLGITDQYIDRRDIEKNADTDKLCRLALDMETYRLKKYIGMYAAVLGRVDAVVFTAGVGENSPLIRRMILDNMENFGIILDKERNDGVFGRVGEVDLSGLDSKVKIFMIPTNEELVLVEDVVGVLNDQYTDHMHYPYSFGN